MPGMGELLIILLIVLLVFGAGKLPGIGESLGKSIRNFKRSAANDEEIEVKRKPALDAAKSKELDEGGEEFEDVVVKRRKVPKAAGDES